jgi:hypothetical protein
MCDCKVRLIVTSVQFLLRALVLMILFGALHLGQLSYWPMNNGVNNSTTPLFLQ